MRLLLDTHALLWMSAQPDRLGSQASEALQDGNNALFVSTASFWEISTKISLNKLQLTADWATTLRQYMADNAIAELPIRIEHCTSVASLPFHHRDPFDRMLIAQAIHEDLTLVSRDRAIPLYAVNTLW